VLACVAGSVGSGRSAIEVAVQVGIGLTVLIAFSLLVLPVLASWAFRLLGAERSVRYVVAITAFLSAAAVAKLFGIESIVGAFFAGLVPNRLVPNEGELMDRIAFFGGAVLIPVFLVSVGLLLDPVVLVQAKTLEYAGLFIVACLGGKALAALVSVRLLGFSRPQAGLLFSLSSAQAAATLAATVIGFQIGLFDNAVVNAVLVVIFVSALVSTIVGARAAARVHAPGDGPQPLGTRVVVGVADPAVAAAALFIAVRIARADGGVVYLVLVVPEVAPIATKPTRERFAGAIAAAGVDGRPSTIVDSSLLEGAVRAGAAAGATLVLVAEPAEADEATGEPAIDAGATANPQPAPVALVRGNAGRIGVVRTVLDGDGSDPSLVAAEMAQRVAGGRAVSVQGADASWPQALAPGDVTFVSDRPAEALSELPQTRSVIVVTTLAPTPLREHHVEAI
jgi:Sodium/hydrogen exchanger family